MATVKTAISIQKALFDQVNQLAEELQMPRSQLFVLAVEEFIERHENRKILEALNEVYPGVPDSSEEALRKGMRRKHRQLVEGEW
ncbi:MAG: ribbon-helix-helix domain-containing protein [Anaerolineae bacterium]